MKVLLTAASLEVANGGPSENVPMLARHMRELDVDVSVMSVRPCQLAGVMLDAGFPVHVPKERLHGALSSLAFIRQTVDEVSPSIIHDNGIWLPENGMMSWVARSRGVELIVSPRGMLEPWAVAYHSLRKKLAWHAYQRRALLGATMLVATSEQERSNIESLLPGQRVEVVPNGWSPMPGFVATDRRGKASRRALFFSRIHPKKGVDILLDAWSSIRPVDWQLHVVGPGDASYIEELKQRANVLGLGNLVKFRSPEYGPEAKARIFSESDVVVLPSFSENFGSVVVEALGHGLPVITTTATPWEELVSERAGWWIAATVPALATALEECCRLSGEDRHAMGQRGMALVARRYGWSIVAAQMRDLYRSVSRRRIEPSNERCRS